MTTTADTPWTDAPLVALDLEGTGAQDREDERILEIAVIPITGGRPSLPDAYTTLLNPGRRIQRHPWISPGLTNATLADAPPLADVEPELARRLNGQLIIGHNVGVDWRLLHRCCPTVRPSGLIDTLRLARHLYPGDKRKSLTALLEHHALTEQVTCSAPNSQPHRALWDTLGTALLLSTLIDRLATRRVLRLGDLQRLAGIPIANDAEGRGRPEQTPLLW
ncbi:3'-5' exonuclease [Actinoallomurus rhizosphaericola]|uniref:3'-5' exonuclease n=1 Tax=Actinoallomurus rhizosphaericola TaxID=2952536 RepID=UPI002092550F|nr:3'-5' exonuclease [Actinoallomurus rhizosphaericola]MCO5999796.1 3'-5' exonuclease [Actinoallomurus rhizosphaericola]